MKFITTILLLIISLSINAQSVTLSVDTLFNGVWDLQGKTLEIKGKISGNVILRNAIIEANRYTQIFEPSVSLENCKADNFSVRLRGHEV